MDRGVVGNNESTGRVPPIVANNNGFLNGVV